MATEGFLVNEGPSRVPGLPECFVVSDSYRRHRNTAHLPGEENKLNIIMADACKRLKVQETLVAQSSCSISNV
ncbi:hypothetical protein SKAU_G00260120 [Synaphobranchus kaupii]|uniref:Uncharacterized protein n=1 Tax=Synaphobranchus kaupii TaxID=118154 RepID=A0A9Q1F503_SYNKA|nr:hypothetical protein SKAU_G00260120 [Synaphobranchus kaupii]